ncbi:hypothetical protein [Phenylobacterium sp.]|uniref:hypothetical protein n=1 Tax=Phenylobacterium sp. TaxID=1871053 RepID=UPI00391C8A95
MAGCRRRPEKDLDGWVARGLAPAASRFHAKQRQAEAMGKARLQAPAGESLAVVSVGLDGKARLKGAVIGGTRTALDGF